MNKKPRKEQKISPALTGLMACQKGHEWFVQDLNPERVTVLCPVCGDNTSIKGFKK
jgi:hypothetical protein